MSKYVTSFPAIFDKDVSKETNDQFPWTQKFSLLITNVSQKREMSENLKKIIEVSATAKQKELDLYSDHRNEARGKEEMTAKVTRYLVEYLNNPDYYTDYHEDGDIRYTTNSWLLEAVTYGLCSEILGIPDIHEAQQVCEEKMPQEGIDETYIQLILNSLEKMEIIQNVSYQVYGNNWREKPICYRAYTRPQAWDDFPEEFRPKFNLTSNISK